MHHTVLNVVRWNIFLVLPENFYMYYSIIEFLSEKLYLQITKIVFKYEFKRLKEGFLFFIVIVCRAIKLVNVFKCVFSDCIENEK